MRPEVVSDTAKITTDTTAVISSTRNTCGGAMRSSRCSMPNGTAEVSVAAIDEVGIEPQGDREDPLCGGALGGLSRAGKKRPPRPAGLRR